jgi:maltose O-acetyltransferase
MKYIAEECGLNVVIKQNAYVGTGRGLRIGNNSQLGVNSRIGPFVSIGSDVVMMTTAHAFENPGEPIRLQGDLPVKSVKVGNDVWIGTRVIVMPGVTLGNGSVIGAGSVVTRDIPPLAIAAGNPARVLRKRGDRINTSS